MTERERDILDQTARLLRIRRLWKDYHLPPDRAEDYPAPLLDALLHLDAIESAVLQEQTSGGGR